ncbi:arylformamidase [Natribacillus halophilus]|uniref:Kynurenine formamidase n=1 Tax=Natribacillus halophilus TaxID=549003 RepID=A0A1G8SD85_9BACI|nr:arylformamidase [Natribacillus halophilus]SDJ26705.1 Kynurenine formamidase [Natribacillus halophilus]
MAPEWIDISQPLDGNIATWPDDTPFSYERSVTKEESGSVNIGTITMSVHTGTHIDAPFHFDNEGDGVLDLDIDAYTGAARLIDVSRYDSIGVKELAEALNSEEVPPRLLLRTWLANDRERFPSEIPYLKAEAASFLREKGVWLIGIEGPSVDPLDSKDLPAHHALSRHGIYILENVMLGSLPVGDYELIALPLPLTGADGSPVRAAVKPLQGDK